VTAPARREVVREMVTQGLSERRPLTVAHMSAATLRYVARPDPDPGLRERIVALAHRHRRYGAGMIYLKLRQEGRRVNHKREIASTPRRVYRSGGVAARKCRWPTDSRSPGRTDRTTSGRPTSSSIAPPKGGC
jgi:hypothetical protein